MAEEFKASVQYDDWKGTAAADNSDNEDVHAFFHNHGVPNGAHVVAVNAYYLSVDGKFRVSAIYADGTGFDSVKDQIQSADTLKFKKTEIELSPADFFILFKRFNIVLTQRDLGLDGREYTIQ